MELAFFLFFAYYLAVILQNTRILLSRWELYVSVVMELGVSARVHGPSLALSSNVFHGNNIN